MIRAAEKEGLHHNVAKMANEAVQRYMDELEAQNFYPPVLLDKLGK